MDVRMPNGHIIANVPDGTSKADLLAKLQRNGFDTEKLLQYPTSMADPSIRLAQHAVGAVQGVSNIFGANNPVSRGLADIGAGIGEKVSKGQKQLEEQNAATMAAAKGKGLGAETKAFLSTVAHDPLGKTAELVGGIAPALALAPFTGGASVEATLAARLAAAAPMAGVMAAQSIGGTKGAIYSKVKEALLEAKVPPKLAEEKAQKAQSYVGPNVDQIALSGALGAIAGEVGLPASAAKALGRKLVGEVVGEGAATAAAQTATKGVARRAAEGFAKDATIMGGLSGQTKMAENIAMQRAGFNTPTFEGVASEAIQQGIMGGALGAGFGVMHGRGRGAEPEAVPEVEQKPLSGIAEDIPAGVDPIKYTAALAEAQKQGLAPSLARDHAMFKASIPTEAAPKEIVPNAPDIGEPHLRGTEPSVPSDSGLGGEPSAAADTGRPADTGMGPAGGDVGAAPERAGPVNGPLEVGPTKAEVTTARQRVRKAFADPEVFAPLKAAFNFTHKTLPKDILEAATALHVKNPLTYSPAEALRTVFQGIRAEAFKAEPIVEPEVTAEPISPASLTPDVIPSVKDAKAAEFPPVTAGEPAAAAPAVEPIVKPEPAGEPAAVAPAGEPEPIATPTLTDKETKFLEDENTRAGKPLEVTARDKGSVTLNDGTIVGVEQGVGGSWVARDTFPHDVALPDITLNGRTKTEAIKEIPAVIEKLRADTAAQLRERAGIEAPEARPEAAPRTGGEEPAPKLGERLHVPWNEPAADGALAGIATRRERRQAQLAAETKAAEERRAAELAQFIAEREASERLFNKQQEGIKKIQDAENAARAEELRKQQEAEQLQAVRDAIADYRGRNVSDTLIKGWEKALKTPGVKPEALLARIHNEVKIETKAENDALKKKIAATKRQDKADAARAERVADAAAKNARDTADRAAKKAAAEQQAAEEKLARDAEKAAAKAAQDALGPVDAEERQENGDPLEAVAKRVEHDLTGKNPFEVAEWLVKQAPDGFRKEVATRVAVQLAELSKRGIQFDFNFIHIGDVTKSSRSRGYVSMEENGRVMEIRIKGGDVTGRSGAAYRTVLHEMIHAVTEGALQAGNYVIYGKTKVGELRKELTSVYKAVQDYLDYRVARGDKLTAWEEAVHERKNNALQNVSELVTWTLSERRMQEWLDTIPYKGRVSIWKKFISTMREFLGLEAKDNTALAEVLRVSENLLSLKKGELEPVIERAQVGKADPSIKEAVDHAETADKEGSEALRTVERSLKMANGAKSAEAAAEGLSEAIKARDASKLIPKDFFTRVSIGQLQFWLPKIPTSMIVNYLKDRVPPIAAVDKLASEWLAQRDSFQRQDSAIKDRLTKFAYEYGQDALARVQALARLHQVDPTAYPTLREAIRNDASLKVLSDKLADPNTSSTDHAEISKELSERLQQFKEVYALWDKLGEQRDGHALFKDVNQYHRDKYDLMRAVLNGNLARQQMSDKARKSIMAEIRVALETAKAESSPFKHIPADLLPDMYSPFKRDGDYYLRIKPEAGKMVGEFHRYDTLQQLLDAKQAAARDLGLDPESREAFDWGVDAENLTPRTNETSALLTRFFEVVDNNIEEGAKGISTGMAKELKDQFYQVFLTSLPEQSLRRQFTHAKGVIGFSMDSLRTFESSSNMYNNQITKMHFRPLIEGKLSEAHDLIHQAPAGEEVPFSPAEQLKMSAVYKEVVERVNELMDPKKASSAVNFLKRAAYMMYLTSGATAGTQYTGIPIRVLPKLSRFYGGPAATAALAKYSNVFQSVGKWKTVDSQGNTVFQFPTVGGSKLMNNPLLRRAHTALDTRGVFGTMTKEILGNEPKATPTTAAQKGLRKGLDAVYNGLTGMFNASEYVSREMSAMAAFELHYKKTGDFDASIEAAARLTGDALGVHNQWEVPRAAKANDVVAAAFQFKMYAAKQTQFFVENFAAATKGDRGAMGELIGVLGMGGLFHGLRGMPMYGLIMAGMSAWLRANAQDDDDDQRPNFMKYDADYIFRNEFMPKHFGAMTFPGADGKQHTYANALTNGLLSEGTGLNIGSHTSFNGMWFRAPREGRNWGETAMNAVVSNIAGVGVGTTFLSGANDLAKGEVQRGLEQMLPAGISKPMTAYRLATEGAENKGGDKIVKAGDIGAVPLIGQVIGFQPMDVAEQQTRTAAVNKQIKKVSTERGKLLDDYNKATLMADHLDPDKAREVYQKMLEFNKRYPFPKIQISADTLMQSQRSYYQRHANTISGVAMNRGNVGYLMPAVTGDYEEE